MKLLVAGEFRFHRGSDGRIMTMGVFGSEFWERYLEVFDEVVIAARVDNSFVNDNGEPVESDTVTVFPLQHYVGIVGLVRNYHRLRRDVKCALEGSGSVLLRAPGPISSIFEGRIRNSRPYAVEIVGDPYEVLTVLRVPGWRVLRRFAAWRLRKVAAGATAVAYVSEAILPSRYPAQSGAHVTSYSSATLPPAAYSSYGTRDVRPGPVRLIAVGSMEQEYKGIDVVLRAFAGLDRGDFGSLRVLGDGRFRPHYERLAFELGVDSAVEFLGMLTSPEAVRRQLDQSDLFVSGSRSEGLPRAMIEAMARGLPCVGTSVGGTSDLLPERAMCRANDDLALAAVIRRFLSVESRAELAAECRNRSDEYAQDVLNSRRRLLYEHLKSRTRSVR